MENKKVTKEKWEQNIRKARQYTSNYSKVRWLIVDLALEVCNVQHGGKRGKAMSFTLSRFAEEIELERKTLYEWVRVKRMVYDKLPKIIRTNAHKYQWTDFQKTSEMVEWESTPKDVRRRWDEQLKIPPESKKFAKYIRHMNAILYNVQRPMIMKDVSREHIETMIEKCEIIATLARKEFALRERFSNKERENMARVNVKGELAKRIAEVS